MAFPVSAWMGLCSLFSYLPHPQFTHNAHTHTHIHQNPKDSIIACPGLCQCPNLSFSSSPQSSHKQRHRHLCTQHTLLHPEAHTSMAFPIVTCVGYAACLALFFHLQRTQPVGAAVILGTSWFGPAAQLVGGTVLITGAHCALLLWESLGGAKSLSFTPVEKVLETENRSLP